MRRGSWFAGLGLAAPLVALAGWIVHGALVPGTAGSLPARATGAPAVSALPPSLDLPAARLEERVDGAADALRAAGCRRLRHWRIEAPPADAEALSFRSNDEAHRALEREAGPGRTVGPGDEAQLGAQAAYFRRGSVLVRLFLDPGASAGEGLRRAAERLDDQLKREP